MKVLIFCAVFCFSTSQGLYTYFGERNATHTDTVTDMSCKLHEFTYRKGDYFVLWIKSYKKDYNTSTAEPIPTDAIVRMSPGMWHRQPIEKSNQYTKVQLYLDQDTITIDVQVKTEKSCEEVRVLEGTRLPKGLNVTESEYNDSCIGGRICVINVVVTSKLCPGKTLRSQPCTYYEQYGLNGTAKNFSAPTNTSRSSRAIDNSKDGVANTYFIIMIVALVTSAVAVILLLIIAIKQRCWVKSNPPAMIQISPISENRYYENVVFRTECDPQANQDEQPIYDEPSPDMHYEEINNSRAQ